MGRAGSHQAEVGLQCASELLIHLKVEWRRDWLFPERLSRTLVKLGTAAFVRRDQHAWMAERREGYLAFQLVKSLEDIQEDACWGLGWDKWPTSLWHLDVAKSDLAGLGVRLSDAVGWAAEEQSWSW